MWRFERVYLRSQKVILVVRCYTRKRSVLIAVAIDGFVGQHIFVIFAPMSHRQTTLSSWHQWNMPYTAVTRALRSLLSKRSFSEKEFLTADTRHRANSFSEAVFFVNGVRRSLLRLRMSSLETSGRQQFSSGGKKRANAYFSVTKTLCKNKFHILQKV